MSHQLRRGEEGAVAITVAVVLLLLMGVTAIALDLSVGLEGRRRTQNAADAAALAAAWEACNPVSGTPDPATAALEVAALNGFDDADPGVTVTLTDSGGEYSVSISESQDTTFAATDPIGADDLTVSSTATAECVVHDFLGGYAIFADGDAACTGGVELDLSGASKIINGGLHSNGDLKVTGSNTTINGDVTYMGSSDYEPSTQLDEEPPMPLEVDISQFRPGGSRTTEAADAGEYYDFAGAEVTDDFLVTNGYGTQSGSTTTITKSGIYYTSNKTKGINLSNVMTAPGVKVTFVSDGPIKVVGSGDLTAYAPIVGGTVTDPGILMFSDYLAPADGGPTCTGNAVQWSVSSGTWTGVIYAPHGQARMSSASSATLSGSIFAYTVNLSGSDFSISWQDNPDAIPDYEVNLLS